MQLLDRRLASCRLLHHRATRCLQRNGTALLCAGLVGIDWQVAGMASADCRTQLKVTADAPSFGDEVAEVDVPAARYFQTAWNDTRRGYVADDDDD